MTFTQQVLDLYRAGDVYLNVLSNDNPGGEVRAQLVPYFVGDGAGNQWFVDEIAPEPFKSPDSPEDLLPFTPLLVYRGPEAIDEGVVAMSHRDQPTLERPGISYLGRSIYTTFGLEGINDDLGGTEQG